MDINISTEYIKLQQLLKLADVLGSGGDIKYFLENVEITVNGQKAYQRGKKVYKGDVVEVEGYETIVVC